ncbi:MAG TPA: SDR family NAD(P)-dependent oxidoreductase [Ktedonobacteraceae bacterium]|nr:SDR family NAD(P)-dependent oxidoreductase [Ktedonobacteraceae bacterium]
MCTDVFTGRKIANRTGKIAWIFPGQGSQWLGMGRDLLTEEPVFREALEQCDQVMLRYTDWPLLEELQAPEEQSHLDRIDVVQPLLFALQVALAALWRSWGIEPDAVVGHSMGEVAAAYVAGALSLDDAARIICGRSKLLLCTSGRGAMAAVELPLEQAQLVIKDYENYVSIAVNNSPNSTVLSGDPLALAEILALLEHSGVFGRLVKVNVASHSPQMNPLRDDLLALLEPVRPRPAAIPICSTVTGEMTDGHKFDAHYWARNLREPVLFLTATQQLLGQGFDAFLEISPHPLLVGAVKQTMQQAGRTGTVLASLRREEESRAVLLEGLAKLYTLGHNIYWDRLYPAGARHVSLPTYPWQRERFWNSNLEGPMLYPLQPGQNGRSSNICHPMLGPKLQSALHPATYFWETGIDVKRFSYLNDHRIQGISLLPSTGYIEMALAAATEVFGAQQYRLENIVLKKALFFPEKTTQTVQVVLAPDEIGKATLQFFHLQPTDDQQEVSWVHCASAIVCPGGLSPRMEALESPVPQRVQQEWEHTISATEHYQRLRASGIEHGPLFQGVTRIWQHGSEVLAQLTVPEAVAAEMHAYQVHPALFDACLQAIMSFLPEETEDETYVPIAIERVRFHRQAVPNDCLWSHAVLRSEASEDSFTGDVFLIDEHGQVLLEVLGFRLQRLAGDWADKEQTIERKLKQLLYKICWEPGACAEQRQPDLAQQRKNWLIFADNTGVGQHLAEYLQSCGATCVMVTSGQAYERVHARHYEVDPAYPEAFQRLLDDAFDNGAQACHGVVYLWGLDSALAEFTTLRSLQTDQQRGCVGVLHLIQAITAARWDVMPRFWLVTRGVQVVTGEDEGRSLAQAPLWGLGRVIVYEHPDLHCTLVDIEASCTPEALATLGQEICSDESVNEVAIRGDMRYIARLVRHTLPADRERLSEDDPLFRTDGTYLITGGLSGVGLKVAQWMVGQGARHLALVGRSGASASVEETIRGMREAGADVRVFQADVAQQLQIANVLTEIYCRMPPLRGIFHSAVVLDDSILLQLNPERFLSIMRPKVEGAWNLHQLTLSQPLDFFVLFSSAASLIGSPGQGNYAAANAFIDALAHYRNARGYPALSINWGRWAEVGQAMRRDRGQRLDVRGFVSMKPQDGLAALERLLRQSAPQVGVMSFNLHKWTQFYPALRNSSLFASLAQEEANSQRKEQGVTRLTRQELLSLPAEQRGQALIHYLGEQISGVLGLSSYKLDVQQRLNRLGIDSLMSIELKNRIASDFGIVMPVATFLQGITLEQLMLQILEHLDIELETSYASCKARA